MGGSRASIALKMLLAASLATAPLTATVESKEAIRTIDAAKPSKDMEAYASTVMAGVDAHMLALKAIADGKVPFWNQAPDQAVAISGAARSLPEIYPDKASNQAFQNAAMLFNSEAARLVRMIPLGNHEATAAQYKLLSEAYDKLKAEIASK